MYSSSQGCHTATGTHMPHGITQCYLPPARGDIPALTPAEAGTHCTISIYTCFAALAIPRFRYRCSAMLTLKIRKPHAVTLGHVHTNVRQIWRTIDDEQCGFKPCRCEAYITTPSCKPCSSVFCSHRRRRLSRFFARRHIFSSTVSFSNLYNDDRALHDLIPL